MAREAEAAELTTVAAPAKLTVTLRVTGRRPDGYHLLDAEMVSIDLADELTILVPPSETTDGRDRPDLDIEVPGLQGDPDGTAPSPADARFRVPTGPGNLVVKALRAVDRRAHVRLVKRIPPGAGLGGGSSDAAAVLRWAGCDDIDVAASLGADVPFCVRGGRARVTGIGDRLRPLPHVPRTYTLLIPPFGCSTPEVYRAWDRLEADGHDRATGQRNDLQAAALAVEPRLDEWRDRLARATGQEPVLAGSGSTWFVEGAYPGEGRIVVHTLPAHE